MIILSSLVHLSDGSKSLKNTSQFYNYISLLSQPKPRIVKEILSGGFRFLGVL